MLCLPPSVTTVILNTEFADFCVLLLSSTPRLSTRVIYLLLRLSRDFINRKSKTRNPFSISSIYLPLYSRYYYNYKREYYLIIL
ncbi:hypothetical protein N7527_006598, partial [Penicillium freii]